MISIKFLGVSAFEVTTEKGLRVLIDPFVTGNPTCPIKVEDITEIDFILVSHAAIDHFGDAPEIARRTGATILCGPDVGTLVARMGVPKDQIIMCCYGDLFEDSDIKVKCVKAEHVSVSNVNDVYMSGQPNGFVVYTESGIGIYHTGDTAIFGDMKLIGQLYQPRILLLGTGMWTDARSSPSGHLSISEAALATQWIGPKVMIPHHGVEMNPEKAQELVRQVNVMAPLVKTVILKPGETYSFGQ